MNYQIRIIEQDGKAKDIVFDFEQGYELLSVFLVSDVANFEAWIKEDFDKVLSGKSMYEEVNGNICGVEIRPSTTKIFDNLADDGMGNWCEIDTKELRTLIDEWCGEYHRIHG